MKAIAVILCIVVSSLALLAGCGGDASNPVAPDEQGQPPQALSWTPIQRLPVSEDLASVDGVGDVSIAVGSGGAILVRLGNSDWRPVERPVDESLQEVVMVSEKVALAIGSEVILRSEDAGETWEVVARTSEALRDIAIRGDNAVAVGGTVLLSDDGGKTWKSPSGTVPPVFYVHVSFMSETAVYTAASGGNTFRSQDAGNSWSSVAVAEITETPTDLEFFDEKFGIASLSSPAAVMWTADGGDTWDEVVGLGTGGIADIDVVDTKNAFVILRTGQIHTTDDAGKTWSFTTSAPLQSFDAAGLAITPGLWSVVGRAGFLAGSRNDGSTWSVESTGRIGRFENIAFNNTGTAVAAFSPVLDPAEDLLRSADGGASWQAVDPVIKNPVHVTFGEGVGLIVGGDEVARSDDDGRTWIDVSPGNNESFRAALILDENTYIVCGRNSRIARTSTRGTGWAISPIETPGTADLLDIDLFPGTDVVVIVSQDRGFRSTDRGVLYTPVNLRARAVACASSDVAVAVDAEILRTTDRGVTWDIVEVPGESLRDVAFADARHGVAVGIRGFMMETLDGGASWQVVTRTTSVTLETIAFADGEDALAGGATGALLLGR